MLFGVSEVPVGALLLADRWASPMAAIVAVSMLGVALNLRVGLAVDDPVMDVLVWDLGLTAYATGVVLVEADGG